jgi:predicted  nucleic acid-binding Zn-ribbon protein
MPAITSTVLISRLLDREDELKKKIEELEANLFDLKNMYAKVSNDNDKVLEALDEFRSILYQGQNDYDNVRDDATETVKEWIEHCSKLCVFPNLYEYSTRETIEQLTEKAMLENQ